MKQDIVRTEARMKYDAAREVHHQMNDLLKAIKLYQDIMFNHPESREAVYSRGQILNIASAVVPERELFNAQVDLVLARLDVENHPD